MRQGLIRAAALAAAVGLAAAWLGAAGAAAQDDSDGAKPGMSTPVSLKGTLPSIPPVPTPVRDGRPVRPVGDSGFSPVPSQRAPAPSGGQDIADEPVSAPGKGGVKFRLAPASEGDSRGRGVMGWLGAVIVSAAVLYAIVWLVRSQLGD